MSRVIAGLTLSLDGFFEDAGGSADALYPELAALQDSAHMKAMQDETGAVLMGRRTFEMAGDTDSDAHTYELQVPLFVLTPGHRRRCPSGTTGCPSRSSPTASSRRSRRPAPPRATRRCRWSAGRT